MRLLALFIFVPRLRGQTREQWLSPVVYLTSIILNQTIDPNNWAASPLPAAGSDGDGRNCSCTSISDPSNAS